MPGHIAPAYVAADANTLFTGSHWEMFEKLPRSASDGVSASEKGTQLFSSLLFVLLGPQCGFPRSRVGLP